MPVCGVSKVNSVSQEADCSEAGLSQYTGDWAATNTSNLQDHDGLQMVVGLWGNSTHHLDGSDGLSNFTDCDCQEK